MKIRLGYLLLVMGIVLSSLTFQDGIASMRPLIDFYGENKDIRDIGFFDMIELELNASLGCFASEITTTKFGATTGAKYFYIIPIWGEKEEDVFYIGVTVPESSTVDYEKLVEATASYLSGDTGIRKKYSFRKMGCVKKMGSKYYDYFVEWFEEYEWFESREELEKYVLPLYFDPVPDRKISKDILMVGIFATLIGAALLLSAFMARLKWKKQMKQRKKEIAQDQKTVVIDGIQYPKSTFDQVNAYVKSRNREAAEQELRAITGVDLADAHIIIDNWKSYYLQ